jgi:NAD(P)-dependent dehydrogenase (short-subunit alcohol dehydrogenase family)
LSSLPFFRYLPYHTKKKQNFSLFSKKKMKDTRIILVTGANKGIGYEAVKLLAQKLPAATVLLGSRSVANGEAAIAKMRESAPAHSFDNVSVVEIDITSAASLKAAVATVRERHGKLDVLLHNSGIASVDGDGILLNATLIWGCGCTISQSPN